MKKITLMLITCLTIQLLNAQNAEIKKKEDRNRYWLKANEFKEAYPDFRHWQVGFGLGEVPMHGSFKPSLTAGYHFNDKFYIGIIYQFKDNIHRGTSSFNAGSTGLNGLTDSRESVGQRFMFQARYTPWKFAPYISFGMVFNDQDQEVMHFAEGDQQIGSNTYHTALTVTQSRKAGWAPAIGIGYQFDFKRGFSINAEWTPGWFVWVPTPGVAVEPNETIAAEDLEQFHSKVSKEFQSHVTNLYKVFHFGLSYRF